MKKQLLSVLMGFTALTFTATSFAIVKTANPVRLAEGAQRKEEFMTAIDKVVKADAASKAKAAQELLSNKEFASLREGLGLTSEKAIKDEAELIALNENYGKVLKLAISAASHDSNGQEASKTIVAFSQVMKIEPRVSSGWTSATRLDVNQQKTVGDAFNAVAVNLKNMKNWESANSKDWFAVIQASAEILDASIAKGSPVHPHEAFLMGIVKAKDVKARDGKSAYEVALEDYIEKRVLAFCGE